VLRRSKAVRKGAVGKQRLGGSGTFVDIQRRAERGGAEKGRTGIQKTQLCGGTEGVLYCIKGVRLV